MYVLFLCVFDRPLINKFTSFTTEKHVVMMSKATGGPPNAPVAPWMFALAGRQHSEKYACDSDSPPLPQL